MRREECSALRCHGQWHDPHWCQSHPRPAQPSPTSPQESPEAILASVLVLRPALQTCSAVLEWMLLRAWHCHLMERLGPAEGNLAFCPSDSPH